MLNLSKPAYCSNIFVDKVGHDFRNLWTGEKKRALAGPGEETLVGRGVSCYSDAATIFAWRLELVDNRACLDAAIFATFASCCSKILILHVFCSMAAFMSSSATSQSSVSLALWNSA